jgi:hypothetical protein
VASTTARAWCSCQQAHFMQLYLFCSYYKKILF